MAGDDDAIDRLREQCSAVGFDLGSADASLVARMRLLAERSPTLDDATRMADYAGRVFRHYDGSDPAHAFTPLERQTVVLAALFSDLGKTGPKGADPAAWRLVAEAFAVENVGDDKQSIATFFRTHFPSDAAERLARFEGLGLDPSMSLREFWNLHSGWTLDVGEAAGLPREAVAAAATHHLLENVNPRALVGADDRFTQRFGDNVAFDRAEKLVIVLDKYDAARRRGGHDHAGAIAWLRERIAQNPRFRDDEELLAIVSAVETALAPT